MIPTSSANPRPVWAYINCVQDASVHAPRRPTRMRRWVYNVLSRTRVLPAVLLLSAPAVASAQEVQCNRDIRPIFSDKCFACHGLDAKHRKAELRLDVPEGAFAERKGHHAIVPGEVTKSELWARITTSDEADVMPPRDTHKHISPAERETIR